MIIPTTGGIRVFKKLTGLILISVFLATTGVAAGMSIANLHLSEITVPVLNPLSWFSSEGEERTDGGHYALVNEQGQVLDQTARRVYEGDEFIDADNKHYRVTKVVGDIAHCEYLGIASLAWEETELSPNNELAIPVATSKPLVGIYHTHGDESYLPSQGVSSVAAGKKGGVTEVAVALKDKLESIGIPTAYNDALHAPHDSGAYHRSRRTASALMKQGAQVLIDVHRDSAPAQAYRTEINGQQVARVKLVVGRRNPNSSANLGYAKKVKAFLDQNFPGLAKGIFVGRGVYNQDLRPTCILLEVGSNQTTLGEAKAAVGLFADTLPKITGINSQTGARQVSQTADEGSNWRSLGWLIAAVIIGGAGYLLISTGSFKGAINKMKHFGGSEWTNFFGRRRTREVIKKEEISGPLASISDSIDSSDSLQADSSKNDRQNQDRPRNNAEQPFLHEDNDHRNNQNHSTASGVTSQTETQTQREYIWEPSVELTPNEPIERGLNKNENQKQNQSHNESTDGGQLN
jgi:stage II sporulation protein P